MSRFTIFLVFLLAFSFANCASVPSDEEKEITVSVNTIDKIGLGLVIKSMSDEGLKQHKVEYGALILEVIDGSPAKEAGLKEGDVVIETNGTKIDDARVLNDLVEALKEGDEVNLTVNSDGEEKSFSTKIKFMDMDSYKYSLKGDGNVNMHIMSDMHFGMGMPHGGKNFMWKSKGGSDKGGWLGVELKNINDQMKEYFEVEHGALVEKVVENSPAEKAGLKAGDVIVKMGDKKIEDPADVIRTVNYYDPEDKIDVEVIRKGDDESFSVTLGKKKGHMMKNMMFISEDGDDEDVHINVTVDDDEPGVKKVKRIKIVGDPGGLKNVEEIDILIYII